MISVDTSHFGPASTIFAGAEASRAGGYFLNFVSLREVDRSHMRAALGHLMDAAVDGIVVIAPVGAPIDSLRGQAADVPMVGVAASGLGPRDQRRGQPGGGGSYRNAPPTRSRAPDRVPRFRAKRLARRERPGAGLASRAGGCRARGLRHHRGRLVGQLRLRGRPPAGGLASSLTSKT